MPVDAEPDTDGQFVVKDGPTPTVARATPMDTGFGEDLYTSHFATCPDADKWRNRDDGVVTCRGCGNKFMKRRGDCPRCGVRR